MACCEMKSVAPTGKRVAPKCASIQGWLPVLTSCTHSHTNRIATARGQAWPRRFRSMLLIRDPKDCHRERNVRKAGARPESVLPLAIACVRIGAITRVISSDETGRLRDAYRPL